MLPSASSRPCIVHPRTALLALALGRLDDSLNMLPFGSSRPCIVHPKTALLALALGRSRCAVLLAGGNHRVGQSLPAMRPRRPQLACRRCPIRPLFEVTCRWCHCVLCRSSSGPCWPGPQQQLLQPDTLQGRLPSPWQATHRIPQWKAELCCLRRLRQLPSLLLLSDPWLAERNPARVHVSTLPTVLELARDSLSALRPILCWASIMYAVDQAVRQALRRGRQLVHLLPWERSGSHPVQQRGVQALRRVLLLPDAGRQAHAAGVGLHHVPLQRCQQGPNAVPCRLQQVRL